MAEERDRVRVDSETAGLFERLADLVYASDDVSTTYAAIVDAAPRLVSGCDHASLMLREPRGLATAASSSPIAQHIDELERELGEGPCVDAIESDAAYLDTDLTDGSAWPRLAERVLAETPVRGSAGLRLRAGADRTGALNLFAEEPGALTDRSVEEGIVLASFVSVALAAAHDAQAARTLRDGLSSNREIGKAVGLMMAFHKITDDEAFAMLRKASQDMNIKLAEVARQVIDHHNSA